MNIVFMGTPKYAKDILEEIYLNKKFNIKAVFTQVDKPIGRKQILNPPCVKVFALEKKLKLYQVLKINSTVNILKELAPDFIVICAYGQIIGEEILNLAPCINLHASILPKYRGASPIQYSLLNDEKFTGVSAMLINKGLDTGDILSLRYIKINKEDTLEELYDNLSLCAKKLIIFTLFNFKNLKPLKQNDIESSYAKKISKEDSVVDFEDAKKLYNKYRAFTPHPGIRLKNNLKLKKISLNEYKSFNKVQGQILEVNNEYAIITCKKGSIKIFNIQAASKKETNISSYLNGARLKKGDILNAY